MKGCVRGFIWFLGLWIGILIAMGVILGATGAIRPGSVDDDGPYGALSFLIAVVIVIVGSIARIFVRCATTRRGSSPRGQDTDPVPGE
jgi:hypothetical protein